MDRDCLYTGWHKRFILFILRPHIFFWIVILHRIINVSRPSFNLHNWKDGILLRSDKGKKNMK